MLGWEYLEKLSKQGVQQLQSTTATPKSIASGERAVMVDGNEYNMFMEMRAKSPVKIIYAKEGTPFVTSPTAIFKDAPHPNAARVFQNFIYTPKVQRLHPSTRAVWLGAASGREGTGRPRAAGRWSCLPTIRPGCWQIAEVKKRSSVSETDQAAAFSRADREAAQRANGLLHAARRVERGRHARRSH